ncbi:MAG: methyltransferase domain-containing protein [Oscillatoriophycideae cyanobacterium NC_groundwater_1537_Pr4_S-0.65um_50_18]|nr:methyltransferase domain-containing protein [Oscillatoriophycideae cyanobacterium NC_groundwater_1537_Pr4_S-0.65um_50_18]
MPPIFHSAKQAIATRFGQAAAVYHAEAQMQKDCANDLINYLFKALPQPLKLPPGKILEVGCGTGFITQELVDCFGDRSLEITDLSPEMLQFCQAHLQMNLNHQPFKSQIEFHQMDGEAIDPHPLPYAMIVSGFTIQWFKDPIATLRNWRSQLQPGGILLISFPTDQSFPEWRQVCRKLNLPFTANPLPNAELIWTALAQEFSLFQTYDQSMKLTFNSAADFFRNLKAIGAGFNQQDQRLSLSQMRQLINYWDSQTDEISVQFHIAFGVLQK